MMMCVRSILFELGIGHIQLTLKTVLHIILPAHRKEIQEELWPLRHVFGTTADLDVLANLLTDSNGKIVCNGSCKV